MNTQNLLSNRRDFLKLSSMMAGAAVMPHLLSMPRAHAQAGSTIVIAAPATPQSLDCTVAGITTQPFAFVSAFVPQRAPGRSLASSIARHRLWGVNGVGTSLTPSGARASRTALVRQATAPTVPASPAPLTPKGLRPVGTPLVSISKRGRSSALGMT